MTALLLCVQELIIIHASGSSDMGESVSRWKINCFLPDYLADSEYSLILEDYFTEEPTQVI